MRFSTVTQELYREAIDLVLDGMDQMPAQAAPEDDEESVSILENWPIEFRTEALVYRPKGQRILAATRWPAVVEECQGALCPAGGLLVSERELVLISQEKASQRLHTGDAQKIGGIIISGFPGLGLKGSPHEKGNFSALNVLKFPFSEVTPGGKSRAVARWPRAAPTL